MQSPHFVFSFFRRREGNRNPILSWHSCRPPALGAASRRSGVPQLFTAPPSSFLLFPRLEEGVKGVFPPLQNSILFFPSLPAVFFPRVSPECLGRPREEGVGPIVLD